MSAWKDRIEAGFETLAGSISRHPVWYLLGVFALVAAIATQLTKVYFDTSTEGFLSPTHPAIIEYNEFRDIFGRDELLVVGVDIPQFSQDFFKQFEALFRQLDREVPHTDSVESILTARHVYGVEDELVVEDLFENWPETDAQLAELKQLIETHPLYKGFFVSPDLSMATIVIRLRYLHTEDHPTEGDRRSAVDKQISEVLDHVYEVIEQHRARGLTIYLAGSPTIVDLLKRSTLSDMQLFVKLVVGIIALVLFLLFRRLSAVVLPLLTVMLAVVTTISLMAAFGQPIQLPTAIVPSFLLAVGVGDSIHFLSLFYRHFDAHGDKQAAMSYGLGHAGLAMFLTSLTTAIGLGSFSTANILPVANMGIFTAVGVMLAFVFTILVLPALLALTPLKPHGDTQQKTPAKKAMFIDSMIDGAIHVACQYPRWVVSVSTVLLLLSLWSASQLHFSHNPLVWLPDDLAISDSVQVIDRKLGGSISVEVLVDTGEETGVYDPALLQAIDRLCSQLAHYENEHFKVAKVLSITDLIKESNRALHGNDEDYYRIPDNRELIAQELFLLEISGADDLYRLVDRQYQKARVTLTIPWIDSLLYEPFMEYLEQEFSAAVGDRAEVTITGLVPLLGSTLRSVIHSTAKSYVIAFVIITLTMVVLLESVRYGLLSMFPNLLPIVVVMGLMQLLGVPLDMFTMLIGSIAIGLCVDDTVHFMHHFRRYLNRGYTIEDSITHTLHTAGRAMLVTTLVLFSGFVILVFSAMNNLTNFGIYTGLTVALALLADFLLAPALMVLFAHRHNET